jgi:hypothetical protein
MTALIQTLETFITDADGTSGAVPVPTAKLGASLSDVHMVDGPALLLSFFSLLDPAELSCTVRPTENRRVRRLLFPLAMSSLCLWDWRPEKKASPISP